ncbi:hypothetical protein [Acinetobacter dispersus]|uniref:hypothetical protein n=1 Tax=Acinetobacter dispersus TaxID=70348 RepID=UPI0021CDC990|nr:hypothetical protein [Acinetobacter dispersus]MCU4337977.1 hypothetical protein [Acinetobacter dispersus]
MGRPQIFLKDWCLEDRLLKAEFLKKESENPRGLIIKNQYGYITNHTTYPQFHSDSAGVGICNGLQIQVTVNCYEKLKAKFRTFKKKDKDKNKVKKQYFLDRETANFLSNFKEKYNYSREENVIEYLVKKHEKQKLDSEHLDKLDKSAIRVQYLKNELAECKEVCSKTENDRSLLKVRINELDDLLASACLLNEFLKEILKEHAIEYCRPLITDDDIERYKAEIRNNLRTYP